MLDKLDRRILRTLETDARQSKSAIAAQLGVSKTLVTYRINRLHKRGAVKGYQYIANRAKLGEVSFGMLIRFQDVLLEEQEAIVHKLKAAKTFDWIQLTTGSWDAIAVWVGRDIAAYNKRLNAVFEQYGAYIRDYNFYVDYAGVVSGHDYLYEAPYPPVAAYGEAPGEQVILDELDQSILKQLDRDATASLLRLSTRLNRTFDTIQSRYRSLIKRGILLKAVPVIDHELLGFSNTICLYKLKPNPERIKALLAFCGEHPYVVRQASCLGHFNLVLNIHSASARQLKETIATIDKLFADIVISRELINVIHT
jgi:DNA-binding Lrp family transcriptional regulator